MAPQTPHMPAGASTKLPLCDPPGDVSWLELRERKVPRPHRSWTHSFLLLRLWAASVPPTNRVLWRALPTLDGQVSGAMPGAVGAGSAGTQEIPGVWELLVGGICSLPVFQALPHPTHILTMLSFGLTASTHRLGITGRHLQGAGTPEGARQDSLLGRPATLRSHLSMGLAIEAAQLSVLV